MEAASQMVEPGFAPHYLVTLVPEILDKDMIITT